MDALHVYRCLESGQWCVQKYEVFLLFKSLILTYFYSKHLRNVLRILLNQYMTFKNKKKPPQTQIQILDLFF